MSTQQMQTTSSLVSLYKNVLASINYYADSGGMISQGLGLVSTPVMIKDKRLMLPTPEVLSRLTDNQIAFHPIGESAARGESLVIEKLRLAINGKLNLMVGTLAVQLMSLCLDPTQHDLLSPDQKEILRLIPDATVKTFGTLKDIILKMDPTGAHRFVNIYLKRNGVLKGVQYYRSAVITFPILDEAKTKELKIFGVAVNNQKDKATILKLFSYILNQLNTPLDYSFGSLSGTAPFFHALINGYAGLAMWLNEMIIQYRDFIPQHKDVWMGNMDWIEDVKDLNIYRGLLPALSGNEGAVLDGNGEVVNPNALAQAPTVTTQATVDDDRLRRNGFNVTSNSSAAPTVVTIKPLPGSTAHDTTLDWTRAVAMEQAERTNREILNADRRNQQQLGWGQQPQYIDPYARGGQQQQPQQQQWGSVPVNGQQQLNLGGRRLSI